MHNLIKFLILIPVFSVLACSPSAQAVSLPDPVMDTARTPGTPQSIVLAGGCFWGVEAVFEHTRGVTEAVSGYAGGAPDKADYKSVSAGISGHAESVKVTYDPAQITLGQILKIYFSVAHDPTQLNRQGPDVGTQYRSAIFYSSPEQKEIAEKYIAQLTTAKSFSKPIVTQITALDKFYPAEDYHQNYAALHPNEPYIVIHDAPKITKFKKEFPELYILQK